MAYSKICTHAGCAVNLFRSPEPKQEGALRVLLCVPWFDQGGSSVLLGNVFRRLDKRSRFVERARGRGRARHELPAGTEGCGSAAPRSLEARKRRGIGSMSHESFSRRTIRTRTRTFANC